jgi:hypothetical protein
MPSPQASVLNTPERRGLRRFSLKLSALVRVCGVPYEFPVHTENISARGMFFYIDRFMNEGAQIEVMMNFSSKVTMTWPVKVRFLGRVLRVERRKRAERAGVAALIEEYDYLPLKEEPEAPVQTESSFHLAL